MISVFGSASTQNRFHAEHQGRCTSRCRGRLQGGSNAFQQEAETLARLNHFKIMTLSAASTLPLAIIPGT